MLAPDLIVTNGNLITLDDAQPRAAAMAVRDGRIVAVGDDRAIAALAGPGDAADRSRRQDRHARVHRFAHAPVLVRPAAAARGGPRRQREHRRCARPAVAAIAKELRRLDPGARLRPGQARRSGGSRRGPTSTASRATRPIIVSRICGHAVVVNSAALALVTRRPSARAGDAETGLYTEGDAARVLPAHPAARRERDWRRRRCAACRVALRTGITSVQTLLDTPDQMAALLAAAAQAAGCRSASPACRRTRRSTRCTRTASTRTFGDEWLSVGAAKLFSDGSLGAQTALARRAVRRQARRRAASASTTPRTSSARPRDAQAKGFQLAIHAIGDQAVRETIDAIEFALRAASRTNVHRHRVEHASVTPPDCLERMAKLKIVATLQPQFVTSDTWTGERLGPRRDAVGVSVPVDARGRACR